MVEYLFLPIILDVNMNLKKAIIELIGLERTALHDNFNWDSLSNEEKNNHEEIWKNAISNSYLALENSNVEEIIDCVMLDENWELPVSVKIAVLRKAKTLGANSRNFLLQYYSYMATHLDPSIEKTEAEIKLDELLDQ